MHRLSELLAEYAGLQPALHPLLEDKRIDVGALAYAVARLPEGITETSFYYLAGTLPGLYKDPDSRFDAAPSRARDTVERNT